MQLTEKARHVRTKVRLPLRVTGLEDGRETVPSGGDDREDAGEALSGRLPLVTLSQRSRF